MASLRCMFSLPHVREAIDAVLGRGRMLWLRIADEVEEALPGSSLDDAARAEALTLLAVLRVTLGQLRQSRRK